MLPLLLISGCRLYAQVHLGSASSGKFHPQFLRSIIVENADLVTLIGSALPHSGDNWDAVQRFDFATYIAFDADERAKRVAYQSFDPGPGTGEAIAINFLRMDGMKELIFAATKIGALLMSNPEEVDQGWLWSQAVEICGKDEAIAALSEAWSGDPRVEAYRRAVVESAQGGSSNSIEITGFSYEDLLPTMPGLRGFRLSSWANRQVPTTLNVQRADWRPQ